MPRILHYLWTHPTVRRTGRGAFVFGAAFSSIYWTGKAFHEIYEVSSGAALEDARLADRIILTPSDKAYLAERHPDWDEADMRRHQVKVMQSAVSVNISRTVKRTENQYVSEE